jgi:hypothetical protein
MIIDVKTGYLLKLDQFGKIQSGTVYRGHKSVPMSEVIQVPIYDFSYQEPL